MSRVKERFDFETDLGGVLNHRLETEQQCCRAARLHEQLLRIHEQTRLAQHVRVEELVARRRENRARDERANRVELLTR